MARCAAGAALTFDPVQHSVSLVLRSCDADVASSVDLGSMFGSFERFTEAAIAALENPAANRGKLKALQPRIGEECDDTDL